MSGSGRREGVRASVGLWVYEITVCQAGVGGRGRPISAPDMKYEVSKQDLVFFFQTKSFFFSHALPKNLAPGRFCSLSTQQGRTLVLS